MTNKELSVFLLSIKKLLENNLIQDAIEVLDIAIEEKQKLAEKEEK